jgi:hypothetical protein
MPMSMPSAGHCMCYSMGDDQAACGLCGLYGTSVSKPRVASHIHAHPSNNNHASSTDSLFALPTNCTSTCTQYEFSLTTVLFCSRLMVFCHILIMRVTAPCAGKKGAPLDVSATTTAAAAWANVRLSVAVFGPGLPKRTKKFACERLCLFSDHCCKLCHDMHCDIAHSFNTPAMHVFRYCTHCKQGSRCLCPATITSHPYLRIMPPPTVQSCALEHSQHTCSNRIYQSVGTNSHCCCA